MTDATAGGDRGAMEQRIIQRSLEDDTCRQRLLENLKAAMEEESDTRLPEGIEIRAVDETPDTIFIVLPVRPADVEDGEPPDRELEGVAGGEGVGDEFNWTGC
jgi:hypothetical protein